MFAERIGIVPPERLEALQALANQAAWHTPPGRAYRTCEVSDFWEPCARAFFILVPPKGHVHRHQDEAIRGITHHLVVRTNPKALNWWMDDGKERCCHLEAGVRYHVQRDPVHWVTNEGDSDRIHLLVEFPCE